ncbi:hypothetical protein QUA41_10435, partial [Microcoleus sp. Pol11C1]
CTICSIALSPKPCCINLLANYSASPTYCQVGQTLSIVIDRTQWGCINILTLALVWEKRAIPLSWSLLPKLGSSNVAEQKDAIAEILPILKDYQVVVLGDREFCRRRAS